MQGNESNIVHSEQTVYSQFLSKQRSTVFIMKELVITDKMECYCDFANYALT